MKNLIDAKDYSNTILNLRYFFEKKGFIEVPTQSRLSILAACEDPTTIATFEYSGETWPLPQTGQMWLEHELLNNPAAAGFFCISTSYRQEPNPIPGRHETIFPMFEFELKGDMNDLINFEKQLLSHLGYYGIKERKYSNVAEHYGVKELEAEHEERMWHDTGFAIMLTHFPYYTSPFWNMKKNGNVANKIDVILHGMETIGSAERSTNPVEMYDLFHSISDGLYAKILYDKFGNKRVKKELDEFLSHDFFPRVGGGIGISRLIRSLRLLNNN